MARAPCARARARSDAEATDFDAVERAILEIEKQVRGLDEVTRSAETIKSGNERILERFGSREEPLARPREMAGISMAGSRFQGETGGGEDSLAERGVCCEPVSGPGFPAQQGRYREFPGLLALSHGARAAKEPDSGTPVRNFPK